MASGSGEGSSLRTFFRTRKKTVQATSTPPATTTPPAATTPPATTQQYYDHSYYPAYPQYPYHASHAYLLPHGYPSQHAPPPHSYHLQHGRPPHGPPHHGPPPHGPQQTPPEASPQDTRHFIEPQGKHFNPPAIATNNITTIIKENMNDPYVQYIKIPQAQRDMMFEEFRRRFTWLPQHESRIRENFHHSAGVRFRDLMHEYRTKDARPSCIGEADWAAMLDQWASDDFKKISGTNKKNRSSSDSGAPLSTGGSIPSTEHARRLRNELSRDPTPAELHARTHRRQGNQEWVDPRVERVHEEYTQTDSEGGSSSGATSRPSPVELWRRAISGKKKGRTYGLGAQGYAYDAQTSHTSTSDFSGESLQDLLRRYDELREQLGRMATQEEVRVLGQAIKGIEASVNKILERMPTSTTPHQDDEDEDGGDT